MGFTEQILSRFKGCRIDNCSPIGLESPEYPARGVFLLPTHAYTPYCRKLFHFTTSADPDRDSGGRGNTVELFSFFFYCEFGLLGGFHLSISSHGSSLLYTFSSLIAGSNIETRQVHNLHSGFHRERPEDYRKHEEAASRSRRKFEEC